MNNSVSSQLSAGLVFASQSGFCDLAAVLLDAGADLNAGEGAALKAAISGGHIDVAKLLVARNADLGAITDLVDRAKRAGTLRVVLDACKVKRVKPRASKLAGAFLVAIAEFDFVLARELVVYWRAPVAKKNESSDLLLSALMCMGTWRVCRLSEAQLVAARDLISALLDRGATLAPHQVGLAAMVNVPIELFDRLLKSLHGGIEGLSSDEGIVAIVQSLTWTPTIGTDRALMILGLLGDSESHIQKVREQAKSLSGDKRVNVDSAIRLFDMQMSGNRVPDKLPCVRL